MRGWLGSNGCDHLGCLCCQRAAAQAGTLETAPWVLARAAGLKTCELHRKLHCLAAGWRASSNIHARPLPLLLRHGNFAGLLITGTLCGSDRTPLSSGPTVSCAAGPGQAQQQVGCLRVVSALCSSPEVMRSRRLQGKVIAVRPPQAPLLSSRAQSCTGRAAQLSAVEPRAEQRSLLSLSPLFAHSPPRCRSQIRDAAHGS